MTFIKSPIFSFVAARGRARLRIVALADAGGSGRRRNDDEDPVVTAKARIDAVECDPGDPRRGRITKIAFHSGFDNLSTFYRVFKSAIGVTASEYRRASRERGAP